MNSSAAPAGSRRYAVAESNLRVKCLGEAASDVDYTRANLNFGSDCVDATQCHFVDRFLSGEEFESNGDDYLQTLKVVDAIYESARLGQVVKL